MDVAVMAVRHVRVGVAQRPVDVAVAVRLPRRIGRGVGVAMVLVMSMAMLVLDRFMLMFVLVPLRQMQPHARTHEQAGRQQGRRQRLGQERDRRRGANEGSSREVSGGARGAQVPERDHEQREAEAIAEKSHQRGGSDDPECWNPSAVHES